MKLVMDFVKNNPFLALLLPTTNAAFQFVANLFSMLNNGNIDPTQLQQMMSSASGFELLILFVIMRALKSDKSDKSAKRDK